MKSGEYRLSKIRYIIDLIKHLVDQLSVVGYL